jgi:hypothetical protein
VSARLDPRADVRDFARVCARCERPFSNLDEELAALGLTRLEWNETREAWRARLGQPGEGSAALARAFGEAFAHESSQAAASRSHASSPTRGEVFAATTVNVAAVAPTAPRAPAVRPPTQHAPQPVATPVAPPAVVIQHVDDTIEPSVDSTLAPIPSKLAAKPLPFREGRGGPPPTVALQMPTPRGDDEGGETLGIAGTIVPTAATPFEEAALERWTVEAYARFVADRRIDPAEQARAAYGLANTAEESALLVHMNKRFGSDPGLLAKWQQLVAARLKERGRG